MAESRRDLTCENCGLEFRVDWAAPLCGVCGSTPFQKRGELAQFALRHRIQGSTERRRVDKKEFSAAVHRGLDRAIRVCEEYWWKDTATEMELLRDWLQASGTIFPKPEEVKDV